MLIGASGFASISVRPMKKQPTKINIMNRLITVTVAAGFALAASNAAAESYSVTDLGVLPDQKHSEPAAINNKGEVAGTSGQSAFRYSTSGKERWECRQLFKELTRLRNQRLGLVVHLFWNGYQAFCRVPQRKCQPAGNAESEEITARAMHSTLREVGIRSTSQDRMKDGNSSSCETH